MRWVSGAQSRPVRWLKRRYRQAMTLGFRLVADRPLLHRGVKRVYHAVPGLRGHLHRFLPAPTQPVPVIAPPAPPPPPVPVDPNEPYIFRPGPAAADSGATIGLDELYHLSRSL